MVKRLAFVGADCLSVRRAAGKDQCCLGCRVPAEDGKHSPLVFWAQMKKAVPGHDAVKALFERQRPHICDDPFLLRKAPCAETYERWRRVHASQMVALLDEASGNGLGGAASDVEDRTSRGDDS